MWLRRRSPHPCRVSGGAAPTRRGTKWERKAEANGRAIGFPGPTQGSTASLRPPPKMKEDSNQMVRILFPYATATESVARDDRAVLGVDTDNREVVAIH